MKKFQIKFISLSILLRAGKIVLIVGGIILLSSVIVLFSIYINRGFSNTFLTWVDSQAFNTYKDKSVLFYDDNCSHCVKVDNNIEDKVDFIRLEVFENDTNKNILADKAQICGLDSEYIGVPFLWIGESKKCVVGYVDIIDFFKSLLKI